MRTHPLALADAPRLIAAGIGFHRPAPRTRWRLPSLWVFHLYGYRASLDLAGSDIALQPGMWTLTPPDWQATYRFAGTSEHWYAHFTPAAGSAPARPLWGDLGDDYAAIDRLLRAALGGSEARKRSSLWMALCRAVEGDTVAAPNDPWQRVAHRVTEHLAEPLYLADLADLAGCSPSTLLRLAKRRVGMPLTTWIRRQRVERARHLLRSTTMRVATIGEAVGIPDPQAFNKIMRAACGRPPSGLRGR